MNQRDYMRDFTIDVSSEIKLSDFEGIESLFKDKEVDLEYDR